MIVPLLLLPKRIAKQLSHNLLGVASRIKPNFKFLEADFYKLDADINVDEYVALCILNSLTYFLFSAMLAISVLVRMGNKNALGIGIAVGLVVGMVIFMLGLVYPKWMAKGRVKKIDKNLLFAARHLRIQTTANVPLFESFVSASHGYGEVSEEFSQIVKSVQAGTNLSYAIEESASKNPSYYYCRILWQVSNAVKAGTDVGPVLSDIVDFLGEEQRIDMRSYGAQLNTLAIVYLMLCIIAPTIGLIFMMIISSFVELPINDTVLYMILGVLAFIQYMFVGLIESRRPVVAI